MNFISFATRMSMVSLLLMMMSCGEPDPIAFYPKFDFTFTRNVSQLKTKTDPVSLHLDSIITGKISSTTLATPEFSLDIDKDGITDLNFEIVCVSNFDLNNIRTEYNDLAVRVTGDNIDFYDESQHGYANALEKGHKIDDNGNWGNSFALLATSVGNGGNFSGKTDKYLGFRMRKGNGWSRLYGWIKVTISAQNDQLIIQEGAYQSVANRTIKAGEK